MDVYLIRHPEPIGATGICYGRSDLPVAADAVAAAAASVRSRLKIAEIDAWYTSPLQRAHVLAEALADSAAISDDRLTEMDFGEWEQQPWSELDPVAVSAWTENYVVTGPPGGESFSELASRVAGFASELDRASETSVGIVTHAGVIRAFLAWTIDIPLEATFRIRVDFGTIVQLRLNADMRLNSLVSLG